MSTCSLPFSLMSVSTHYTAYSVKDIRNYSVKDIRNYSVKDIHIV